MAIFAWPVIHTDFLLKTELVFYQKEGERKFRPKERFVIIFGRYNKSLKACLFCDPRKKWQQLMHDQQMSIFPVFCITKNAIFYILSAFRVTGQTRGMLKAVSNNVDIKSIAARNKCNSIA